MNDRIVRAPAYVHGYSPKESERLTDQADTLATLVHEGTTYPAGHMVLEPGCGIGSQTVFLATNSPGARITSIDLSEESLAAARRRVTSAGLSNVTFQRADVCHLPFADGSFDDVFVCYLLEHLPKPEESLAELRRVLKRGGTMTVVEGDHGSAFFHPDSEYAKKVIQCLVDLQAQLGGNSLIGRQLYPILTGAGFQDVRVQPRMVYADSSRPHLVEGFTKKTFTAMVEGVREDALEQSLISRQEWDRGVDDLYRTAQGDGVFCYTFFKAVGYR